MRESLPSVKEKQHLAAVIEKTLNDECLTTRAGNGFAVAHPIHLATLAVVKEVAEVESLSVASVAPDPKAPIPKQIRYIIGNEGCERFSFYGMRNILTVFLVSSLLQPGSG